MEKDRDVVKFLNPDQTPLITADQPLFVLANQIQCEWDTEYGEGKYVVMLGGLHIEMACFKLLGDLLCDCGWTTALSDVDISTSGTAQSFWSCSNTNKTRQAHQVTVCVLFDLLMSAFESCHIENVDESIDVDTFLAWCSEQKINKNTF
jgi:hypothetical protein